ncbi:FMN-binding protein [Anaerocolumna sedimenticola]|uniref:FMN-binding protein n=1 Tax=Anaerocolumna sedimenticola TaxID=2696063 RepID=A0A6P1TS35_9FIRM|nr:FMN-binding protein [Anaerocolumna sedimenticola]QHQ62761.1 FMN-binding protein [Anaerocolumna sedimenticola]
MKTKKKARILVVIVCVVLLIAAAYFINYMLRVNRYQEKVSNLTYNDIDISSIADGTYIGECDVDFIYAKVEVTVKGGKLTNVKLLEHKNEHGSNAEAITDKILQEQRIDVDVISGATNSSKVIKKAVENALEQ